MLVERGGDPDFVKVVDFGIAKMPTRTNQPLTALGSVFGTPEYLSPEQARGQTIDHRSDLYTVGIVIYEMLTGATPFASPNLGQVIMAQLSKAPPPLPPQVDGELRILVSELLAKDPASRPQTAAEVAARLGQILARLAPGHPLLLQLPGAQAVAPAAPVYQQPSPPYQAPAPVVAAAPVAPQQFAPVPVAVAPAAPPAPVPQYQAPPVNYSPQPAAPAQPAAPTFANPDPIEIPTNRGGCAVVWVGLVVLVVLAGVLGFLVYRMM
jgi:serine/threonine-protein kinase